MEHRRTATGAGRADRRGQGARRGPRRRQRTRRTVTGAGGSGLHRGGHRPLPTAVAAATKAAQERNLPNATFIQDDITTFTGFDGRFDTVVDSTLFHSLPVEGRDGYQRSVYRAAAPGAVYYVLVFAKGAFPPEELQQKPNEVDEPELRAAVGKYWEVDEIRPAFIHANMPSGPDVPFQLPPHDKDDKGRTKMPAFLLTAHKAG